MNHKELIAAMASKMNAPKSVVADLLDKTISTCVELLAEEKTIGFQSFGNFEVRKKEERLSVHPSTQIRTLIPPKLVVNFKQSNILKEKIKDLPHHE
ncbi:MAG TPA: HU family DNA-binding protein [Paludibacter sp.]|nr:HU family DNA-binding protein [Paludibacter sp.]